MKATITIAGVDVEVDSGSAGQLYRALADQGVLTEHKHHYFLAPLDGDETVEGICWCGDRRRFVTYLDGARYGRTSPATPPKPNGATAAATAAATDRARPRCPDCRRNHL